MGEDFCYCALTSLPGQKLNWNAGFKKLKELAYREYKGAWASGAVEEIEDECDYPIVCESGIDRKLCEMEAALEDVKEAVAGNRRDCGSESIGGVDILVSGGMTWGDDPTDTYTSISKLEDCGGILEAVGFYPNIPDYRTMLERILTVKNALPELMGLDEELDKMIEPVLKEE